MYDSDYLSNIYIHERKRPNIVFSYNEMLLGNGKYAAYNDIREFQSIVLMERRQRSTKEMHPFP